MPKKIALITGISGQDGAYLAKFLLKKNYKASLCLEEIFLERHDFHIEFLGQPNRCCNRLNNG